MAKQTKNKDSQAPEKNSGHGMNKCQICGRKQGLVRQHNIMLCRQCFRETAPKIGFKKMN